MPTPKVEVSASQEGEFIEILKKHGQELALLRPILLRWAEDRVAERIPRLDVGVFMLSIVRRIYEGGAGSPTLAEIRHWQGVVEPLIDVLRETAELMFTYAHQRNLQARELEKAGQQEEAIKLYEANVAEGCQEAYPYERLRVIYTARHDYASAIHVCEVAIRNRVPLDRTHLARLRLLYKGEE
jgi:hypothetical protein